MKITEDKLKPGMIIYSVPCNFNDPEPDDHKVFVMQHGSALLLIPARMIADFTFCRDDFDVSKMVKLDFYTTWETALIAAKDRRRLAMTTLQLRENKIQFLINDEGEKNENN